MLVNKRKGEIKDFISLQHRNIQLNGKKIIIQDATSATLLTKTPLKNSKRLQSAVNIFPMNHNTSERKNIVPGQNNTLGSQNHLNKYHKKN